MDLTCLVCGSLLLGPLSAATIRLLLAVLGYKCRVWYAHLVCKALLLLNGRGVAVLSVLERLRMLNCFSCRHSCLLRSWRKVSI